MSFSDFNKGGKGQWAVYYPSPQRFILTFSNLLAQQLLLILIGLFNKLSVQTLQPLIVIYSMGIFGLNH